MFKYIYTRIYRTCKTIGTRSPAHSKLTTPTLREGRRSTVFLEMRARHSSALCSSRLWNALSLLPLTLSNVGLSNMCICMHMCVSTYIDMYWSLPPLTLSNVGLSNMYIYMYAYVCIYICMHMRIYMYAYVCMYMYRYALESSAADNLKCRPICRPI